MRHYAGVISGLCLSMMFVMNSQARQMIHDTLFFKREIKRVDSNSRDPHNYIHYSATFLEKDKSSEYYKRVLDYDFKKITALGNFNPKGKIDTNAMREIPGKWYPVKKYKGKFYIFSINFFNKDLLTDTAFLRSGMEGVFSNGLNSFKKINKNTFQLNANTWHNKTFNLRIHILDTIKGLAVFEYFTSGKEKHDYRLMVGGDEIKSFPLIVSFSQTQALPDTTWYEEEPGNFYTDFFDAKSLLHKKQD